MGLVIVFPAPVEYSDYITILSWVASFLKKNTERAALAPESPRGIFSLPLCVFRPATVSQDWRDRLTVLPGLAVCSGVEVQFLALDAYGAPARRCPPCTVLSVYPVESCILRLRSPFLEKSMLSQSVDCYIKSAVEPKRKTLRRPCSSILTKTYATILQDVVSKFEL